MNQLIKERGKVGCQPQSCEAKTPFFIPHYIIKFINMKKNLLLLGTVFFLITSLAFPLLGFALLEPSIINLLFICLLFCMCVVGTYAFCEAWIKERRQKPTKF